jgi:hypothetical protein
LGKQTKKEKKVIEKYFWYMVEFSVPVSLSFEPNLDTFHRHPTHIPAVLPPLHTTRNPHSTTMASKNEKLCMAIIKNSKVTNINWDAVAKDIGVETKNVPDCQWRRFKKTFDTSSTTKPAKPNGSKKRAIEEISDGEEGKVVRKQPAKKGKGKGRSRKSSWKRPSRMTRPNFLEMGLMRK